MDWFYILFSLTGILFLCSGIYEWKKSWRLNTGLYLPNLIGERNTRLFYMGTGASIFAIGTGLSLQDLFSGNPIICILVGIFISIVTTSFLFRLYEGISIVKFLIKPSDSDKTEVK